MNKDKIIYWVATGLLSAMYFGGAVFYITQGEMVRGMYGQLGFPAYLVTLLIIAKIAAPIAILVRKPVWLSDLAYSGIFWHLLLAVSAHVNAGDSGYPPAVIGLILLAISFLWQNKVRAGEVSPYARPRAA